MTTHYHQCTLEIDDLEQLLSSSRIDSRSYIDAVGIAIEKYLRNDDPRDDLDLLIAYARLPMETLQDDPVDGDRVALESFDRIVRSYSDLSIARIGLQDLLDSIREQASSHLADAHASMIELCRHGVRDHPRIFTWKELVSEVLELAAEIGAVDALSVAVHPDYALDGQICRDWQDSRSVAFNLLAELASRPQHGAAARDALINLASFPDTAGLALCRLPVHLMTIEQCQLLERLLDGYIDLLETDFYQYLNTSHELHRVPNLIRGILWQANDARHFT